MLDDVVGKAFVWMFGAILLFGVALKLPEITAMLTAEGGQASIARDATRETGSRRAERGSDRPAGSVVELKAGANGHFFTDASVNGRSVDVMVDTGASMVALTYEAAERAGIFVRDGDYTMRASTANGITRFAPVTLTSVSIGDITVRDVRAAVAEPGKLSTTLLGMSFLGRLERFELRSGRLVLEK